MQWISVKDKLPDNEDYVFLYDIDLGTIPTVGWYESSEGGREGFFTADHCLRLRLIVTHWMPLPELPRAFSLKKLDSHEST